MNQRQNRGQLQITFHWIYVLIAGAIILLFFFSLILSQQQQSEEFLQQDITRLMGSLFTVASLSEKTKTNVDTNLDQYTLSFTCRDGVSEYGLRGRSQPIQDPISPLFSPRELQTPQLSLWSLPYKLPYKVIDFLFVTSPNTKYVFLGFDHFVDEFLEETKPDPQTRFRITALQLTSTAELATLDSGKNFQVRIVVMPGMATAIAEGKPIPEKLQGMDDERVTAVVFQSENIVQYFQKEGNSWRKKGGPVTIVSLAGERDAATYAAVFAHDGQVYQCTLQKAFQRLQYLNEVLAGEDIIVGQPGGKLKQIKEYYAAHPDLTLTSTCQANLELLQDALQSQQNLAGACLKQPAACAELTGSARQIQQANEELIKSDCIPLY